MVCEKGSYPSVNTPTEHLKKIAAIPRDVWYNKQIPLKSEWDFLFPYQVAPVEETEELNTIVQQIIPFEEEEE
jgi:hypothetical protein